MAYITFSPLIPREALSSEDVIAFPAREILTFATNMEQAGDLIEGNLLGIATKKLKRGVMFSPEGHAELLAMIDRLAVNSRIGGLSLHGTASRT